MFRAFIMTIGMFTIIPIRAWHEDCKKFVLSMLPVVGLVIGSSWFMLGNWLFSFNSNIVFVVLIAIFPQLLSGFIHLDGLMDCCDAVFSRRDLTRRREILKDPLTGAFGVIAAIIFISLMIAGIYDASGKYAGFLLIPVISRAVASLALMSLKPISDSGYGAMFKDGAHRLFVTAFALACIALSFRLGAERPVICTAVAGILSAAYFYKQLDGISGDVCGAAICVAEVVGVISI